MSAWWTRIDGKVEKHRDKLAAGIALNFAHNLGGVPHAKLALYKQDPERHPDAVDLLPAELGRAAKRTTRKAVRHG